MEYAIDYKIGYSNLNKKWKEENVKTSSHKSNPSSFEYSYQADKQEVSFHNFFPIIIDNFLLNIDHRRYYSHCESSAGGRC